MTAGPSANKVAIAAALTVWLIHGLAVGEVSVLDLVLALTIIAALLWPEPVPGRETLDPLPRILPAPGPSSDGWPAGYRPTSDDDGYRWECDDGRAGAAGLSKEAARLGAWRDSVRHR